MRGRKPKPAKLKEVTGRAGHRPVNKAEPQPRSGVPSCPTWLDESAQALWSELVPELDRLGLLTIVDGNALAAYCQACSEFEEATKSLQEEGRFFTTETGQIKPHPAAAQQRAAMNTIRAFAALFGLDPSSRARLKTEPKESQNDPLAAFLNRGKKKR